LVDIVHAGNAAGNLAGDGIVILSPARGEIPIVAVEPRGGELQIPDVVDAMLETAGELAVFPVGMVDRTHRRKIPQLGGEPGVAMDGIGGSIVDQGQLAQAIAWALDPFRFN